MVHTYLAELLGTILLSFVIFTTKNVVLIGLGLIFASLLFGKTAGGMFNPAITIAMLSADKISSVDFIPMIMCQVIGALIGYHVSVWAK